MKTIIKTLFKIKHNHSKNILRSFTKNLLCFIVLLASSLYAQDPAQYGTPFAGVPDTRDVNMYQVHIRPHSAAGNLAAVTADLDRIKSLGINVVYVMPIYPHGTDSRSTNSPYCIKDYKAVATEYGDLTAFRNLVDGAHARGMAVMLDIAVNGTSWDHPWTLAHPEYYLRTGTTINQLANFGDIAALDLNNTALRAAIKDAMRYWIFAANIDGYRCDFANNPPLDFWTDIINDLRSINSHKLLMLAEGDRLQNFQAGFDMNFGDKWFYDALKNVAGGGPVSTRFQTTNDTEYTFATGSQQEVRWTANHDSENSLDTAPFTIFKNNPGVVANFLVSGYMKGVPFLTSGQEVAFDKVIPWPYTGVKIDWSNTAATPEFAKILNFRNSSVAIRRGGMASYASDDICAFTKILGTEKVVVMVNLRNASKTFTIPAGMAGTYNDAYSGVPVTLTSGTIQSFNPFQYIVLTNTNVALVPVTGVSVSPSSVSLGTGSIQQLSATIAPLNASDTGVVWSSSDNAVATVATNGLVTASGVGTATITAKTNDGAKTSTATITVTPSTALTVHFFKPSNWGTGIRIYYWSAMPTGILADASWPGVLMTNNGNGWYSYTFTNVTSTNLIFNDGTIQTGNLSRDKTGWYSANTWSDTNPSILGIESFDSPAFSVYPNPTKNNWKISNTNEKIQKIQIIDISGKVVKSESPEKNEVTIDASTLTNGIYFAKITSEKALNSVKLIKN
jgi:Starch-binding module 26/Alpha amylase, catalytic domain/Bacterial Ig-like domain (group 2)/Secretion system C-terminal sorting domain